MSRMSRLLSSFLSSRTGGRGTNMRTITRIAVAIVLAVGAVLIVPHPASAHLMWPHPVFRDRAVTTEFAGIVVNLQRDFLEDFSRLQKRAETLYNIAAQKDLEGEEPEKAIPVLRKARLKLNLSMLVLDRAIMRIDQLIDILDTNELIPEFEVAVEQQFKLLDVNALPRVSEDARQLSTFVDAFPVFSSEFLALRQMTERLVQETRAVEAKIEQGERFMAALLQPENPLDQALFDLTSGRGQVTSFVINVCNASIRAAQDVFPLGFEFLMD